MTALIFLNNIIKIIYPKRHPQWPPGYYKTLFHGTEWAHPTKMTTMHVHIILLLVASYLFMRLISHYEKLLLAHLSFHCKVTISAGSIHLDLRRGVLQKGQEGTRSSPKFELDPHFGLPCLQIEYLYSCNCLALWPAMIYCCFSVQQRCWKMFYSLETGKFFSFSSSHICHNVSKYGKVQLYGTSWNWNLSGVLPRVWIWQGLTISGD